MTRSEPSDQATEALDPGLVRAGAAAAARRRELDISQRSLAADGIINAGALIAFEKGRAWPRESTRAKLEAVLRWPPGTIVRLRHGEHPVAPQPSPPPEPARTDGADVPLIAQAMLTAVDAFDSAIEGLPDADDPDFAPRASRILAELRQLEGVAAQSMRINKLSPLLIKALSAVRSRYDKLMLRAALAPKATLGQRLYAARRGANLTIDETAQAAGVSERDVLRVEAEESISAEAAAAIEALIGQLS